MVFASHAAFCLHAQYPLDLYAVFCHILLTSSSSFLDMTDSLALFLALISLFFMPAREKQP